MSTLYASFVDAAAAERAVGALLDNGAVSEDISILANQRDSAGNPVTQTTDTVESERSAKGGLSTTTANDVATGTIKGVTAGVGIGTLAALASLFIPGVGLVIGGGALWLAFMGGAGTMIAGAAAGGIVGFLKDQGLPDDVITHYSDTFLEGGTILAIAVPSGKLDTATAEGLLTKYGSTNIATVNSSRTVVPGAELPSPEPLVVQGDNPDIAPVMYAPPMEMAEVVMPPRQTTTTTTTTTVVDSATTTPRVEVVDAITGDTFLKPIETDLPNVMPPAIENPGVYAQATTLPPNTEVVSDSAGNIHQTVGRSTLVSEQPVVVTDPTTGQQMAGTIVEEQHAVMKQPTPVDSEGHAYMPIEGPEETVIVREKHLEFPD